MNLTLNKIQNEIPKFGHLPLTEIDFFLECQKREIEVIESSLYYCDGITLWINEKLVIVIAKQLRGQRRLKAMWHEFAHALLHAPCVTVGAWFCGVSSLMTRKQEQEVEDFVAVALGEARTDRWCKRLS